MTRFVINCYWNANSFNADHYCQFVIQGANQSTNTRVDLADTDNFYSAFNADLTQTEFYKIVNGTYTQIGSPQNLSFDNGGTLRLESEGNNHTVYNVGSGNYTWADSTHPDHQGIGIGMYDNNYTTEYLDDFEGGDLGAAAYTLTITKGSFAFTGISNILKSALCGA